MTWTWSWRTTLPSAATLSLWQPVAWRSASASGSLGPAPVKLTGQNEFVAVQSLFERVCEDCRDDLRPVEGVIVGLDERLAALGRMGPPAALDPGHTREDGAIGNAAPESV